ncbi:type II toxin-antitoxin system HicA family toxin [Labedella endophytica]|uniref:Addiction module toxin, HicA family n=1 Tax=Labedella endophytica TaxID=1523160 RepID=A0A3S0Y293_9MICO|nr:type II toxin-antitoxin system HicA family toxin [Labedella endophytica]RUR03011.1 addiction module toxin, HicA family [Labedella endophytica]
MRAYEVNRRIEKLGGRPLRQRGSHLFFEAEFNGVKGHTTVPQHSGDIPKGLLSKIQRDLEPVFGKGWLR